MFLLKNLIYTFVFTTFLLASGAYDNGTATGKGKFQLDLTYNPFNYFDFGQSYAVMSYGVSNKFDIHGYISNHKDNYYTYYAGLFYQFYKSNLFDLATAVGFRKKISEKSFDIFVPQLLYTIHINKKLDIGGSFVKVNDNNYNSVKNIAVDIGLFYALEYQTKLIDQISFGITAFHPANNNNNAFFLPTYSIDIKFK